MIKNQEQLKPNDPCFCGSGKKYKKCHTPIERRRSEREICGVFDPDLPILPPKFKDWERQPGNYPLPQPVPAGNNHYVRRVVWSVVRKGHGQATPPLTGERLARAKSMIGAWEQKRRQKARLLLGATLGFIGGTLGPGHYDT